MNSATSALVAPAPAFGLLTVEGPDAASFLHNQLSTDVAGMADGQVRWSTYNSPKGRMLASLLLWRRGREAFAALVAADLAEALAKRLSMYVLRAKAKVADRSPSGRRYAVAGAGAGAAVAAALGTTVAAGTGAETADAWLFGAPDGRILVHADAAHADAVLARLSAHAQATASGRLDWEGIRAGIPLVTRATQDLFIPQTANFDLTGGVDFNKGCYPGQEIVARMQYLGRLKERLFAYHAQAEPPAPGTPLFSAAFGEQACGNVASAAPAPDGGTDLLAVVQRSAHAAPDLRLGSPDGPALAPRPLPYAVPDPVAPERPKL
ncbi:MAG: folate-binding protein [Burkholderiales bacterium]